ncbi:DUF1573 domain-containing protein [Siansivirga zeaxanthinifaciens]|uniref:DUF1573 domain-containing protein n=1 Tax=Siansivirga zeaxanthinifaciens CC-SAMT-1 TaxID=1454006 RepID=A0A0C5WI07_9FLAO|nr:DUF1573 domain-containing protein [Siansivirga zeaxanthinifaciens]AJR02325.1 hypothetical protein AW14_00375 [Siansivirga zeaxanthinifaciens CC-SAMT-1]
MTLTKTHFSSLKTTLTFVFFLFVYAVNFAQETDSNAGVLTFKEEEIDYGTIKQNADGERIFSFTNTGKSPIVISTVKTSCGCTVPSYSKEPILPGKTSEIKVRYATNRIGVFKKTITIVSNASEPNKIIRIKGEVLAPESATK